MKFLKGLYEFKVELEANSPENPPIVIKAYHRANSKFALKAFQNGFLAGAERALEASNQFAQYRWARHGWKFDRE